MEVKKKKTSNGTEVAMRDIGKAYKELPELIMKHLREQIQSKFADASEINYNMLKKDYETILLENEDQSKNVKAKIPSELKILKDKDGNISASITAASEEDANVLYTADHGTGMSVSPETLKTLGVEEEKLKDENGDVTEYSAWYFTPKNIYSKWKTNFSRLFGSTFKV